MRSILGSIIVCGYAMYGVVDGAYQCHIGRTLELSQRMAARNIPSAPLQPQFGIRPVSTKYAIMPIIDRRAPATVPLEVEPTYNPELVFNPGSSHAPWSGFASSINEESALRNQFFALPDPLLLYPYTCRYTRLNLALNDSLWRTLRALRRRDSQNF